MLATEGTGNAARMASQLGEAARAARVALGEATRGGTRLSRLALGLRELFARLPGVSRLLAVVRKETAVEVAEVAITAEEIAAAQARWARGEVKAGEVVIKGGLDPATKTALDQLRETMPRIMNRVVNGSSKTIRPSSIRELHRIMTEEGFSLFQVEKFGPEGGYQLFYRKGNVAARFKTLGNAKGVRVGEPHISFSLTDGRGLKWENDVAKINAKGQFRPKSLVNEIPRPKPDDVEKGTRPFWYVEERGATEAAKNAWGSATHFNVPAGFNWEGLAEIIRGFAPK